MLDYITSTFSPWEKHQNIVCMYLWQTASFINRAPVIHRFCLLRHSVNISLHDINAHLNTRPVVLFVGGCSLCFFICSSPSFSLCLCRQTGFWQTGLSADEEENGLSWKLYHRLVTTVTVLKQLLWTQSTRTHTQEQTLVNAVKTRLTVCTSFIHDATLCVCCVPSICLFCLAPCVLCLCVSQFIFLCLCISTRFYVSWALSISWSCFRLYICVTALCFSAWVLF